MTKDLDSVNRRRNLGFFFDQSVVRCPDKVCIIDLFGGQERAVTYRQLDERMDAVARMLARLGVSPGERVAMLCGNRGEFVEFFFGAMRAGAIPVPLNTRLATDTLTYIFKDSDSVLALIDPSCNREAKTIALWCRYASGFCWTRTSRASRATNTNWPRRRAMCRRRRSPTTRRRSSPTRRGPPACRKARS
jgi:acyl-CoA synthetase (AMP-forming)/AMP-acid ligase II